MKEIVIVNRLQSDNLLLQIISYNDKDEKDSREEYRVDKIYILISDSNKSLSR